jgi:beta-lactamase class A
MCIKIRGGSTVNFRFKKVVYTAALLMLIGSVALALIYFGKEKDKSAMQALLQSSSNSPDELYYGEQMDQIKILAQKKRIENNKTRLNNVASSQGNNKPITTVNTDSNVDKIIKSNMTAEQKVREYLGTKVSKIGMAYYDIESGETFSINGDKYYTAASTVKVQMNMVLFDMVKEGKVNINEALQYTQADYEAGTGILQGKDKSKPIPLLTLSDYSIIYSDNIATNMIIRRIVRTEMKKRFGQIVGHSVPMDQNSVTPNEGLTFLKRLYENKNKNEYYTRLIGVMKTTVFHDRLDKYVPKNIVAHKIGNYGAFVNDVGIVYAQKPYIVAIYTEGMPNANEVIATISKILYEAHK